LIAIYQDVKRGNTYVY